MLQACGEVELGKLHLVGSFVEHSSDVQRGSDSFAVQALCFFLGRMQQNWSTKAGLAAVQALAQLATERHLQQTVSRPKQSQQARDEPWCAADAAVTCRAHGWRHEQ